MLGSETRFRLRSLTHLLIPALVLGLLFGLAACQPEASAEGDADADGEVEVPSTVEMAMGDYVFGTPASLPSGWVTFQMENVGEETHEFILQRLPEGKTFEDLRSEVIEPLDSLQQLLIEGAINSTEHEEATRQALPKWFSEVEYAGGGGYVGPGQTAQTTLELEPGEYAMVCFIPSPNGRRHAFQGMARPVTVTEASSGVSAPAADVTIESAGREISVEDSFSSGKQTVAFHVEELPADLEAPYSNAFLASLGPKSDMEDFRDFGRNMHSTDFLGGVLHIPSDQTGYATVNLEPGRYAWVFPRFGEEDILTEEFTVE